MVSSSKVYFSTLKGNQRQKTNKDKVLCTRLSRGGHRGGTKGRAEGFGFQGRWSWPAGYHNQGGSRERRNQGNLGHIGGGAGMDQCWGRLHGEIFSVHPGGVNSMVRLWTDYGKSLQGKALGISLRGKESEDSTRDKLQAGAGIAMKALCSNSCLSFSLSW